VGPNGEGGYEIDESKYIHYGFLLLSSKIQTTEPNVRKRQASESIDVSEDELFLHFLVVETTDETPVKFSIFTFQNILLCAVGNVKSC